MRSVSLAVVVLFFSASARSDNLPGAPTPKVEQSRTEPHNDLADHRFCNREARYALAIEGAAWAGDMAMTCRNLRHHGQEFVFPSQNCGALIGVTLGFHVAAEGTFSALVRHGIEHLRTELRRRTLQRTHPVSGCVDGCPLLFGAL